MRLATNTSGLRASSPLAIATEAAPHTTRPRRPPRATLGRLLAERGPDALAAIAGELADGAIIDSRVLLADHLGADEAHWPSSADRFASDLLRLDQVTDPWLADLTRSAATAPIPVLLGAHTLVGPGIRLLLGGLG